MDSYSVGENLLLGLLVLVFLLWMRPGLKAGIAQSRHAKSDWGSVLVPIGFVILFVIFLIATV